LNGLKMRTARDDANLVTRQCELNREIPADRSCAKDTKLHAPAALQLRHRNSLRPQEPPICLSSGQVTLRTQAGDAPRGLVRAYRSASVLTWATALLPSAERL